MGWEVVIRTLDRFPPVCVFSSCSHLGLVGADPEPLFCLPFSSQSSGSAAQINLSLHLGTSLCFQKMVLFFYSRSLFFWKTLMVSISHNQTLLPELQGHSQCSPLVHKPKLKPGGSGCLTPRSAPMLLWGRGNVLLFSLALGNLNFSVFSWKWA